MNKIVIHVDSLRRDGAERVSVNLAKYLTAHGVCCTLVTERVADFEYDCPEGVERISLGVHGNKYAHYLGNVVKFRRILKDLKPDTLLVRIRLVAFWPSRRRVDWDLNRLFPKGTTRRISRERP